VDETVVAQVTFEALPSSVRAARRLLADVSGELDLSAETIAVAQLALSELVTNAVLHGTPPIVVRITAEDQYLHVGVADSDPTEPRADEARLDATSGRGLAIVAAVAGVWGVDAGRDGTKTVWFTIAR